MVKYLTFSVLMLLTLSPATIGATEGEISDHSSDASVTSQIQTQRGKELCEKLGMDWNRCKGMTTDKLLAAAQSKLDEYQKDDSSFETQKDLEEAVAQYQNPKRHKALVIDVTRPHHFDNRGREAGTE